MARTSSGTVGAQFWPLPLPQRTCISRLPPAPGAPLDDVPPQPPRANPSMAILARTTDVRRTTSLLYRRMRCTAAGLIANVPQESTAAMRPALCGQRLCGQRLDMLGPQA